MTPKVLDDFRGILEVRQAELEEQLRKRDVIAVESAADMLDQIQCASERDMAMNQLDRESARLREIRAALHRIHEGTFGICIACEEAISPARLAALPWTASCVVCREAADRRRDSPSNASDEPAFDTA
jgi:DnaK suppressor protein